MSLNNNLLPSDSSLQSSLHHAYDILEGAIEEWITKKNVLQMQLTELESDNKSLRSVLSKYQATFSEAQHNLTEEHNRRVAAETQLADERKKRSAVETQLDKERSQNVQLRKEVKELQSKQVFISQSSRDKEYIDIMHQYLAEVDIFDHFKERGYYDDKFFEAVLDLLDKMDKVKLTRENEQMRTQQQSWRESEEYKAEIAKYEKASKQKISVDQVKEGLKKILQRFTSVSELSNFIYHLNDMLRKTAWDMVSLDIIDDMTTLFNQSQQKQPTTINYNAPVTNNGTMNGDVNNNTSKS